MPHAFVTTHPLTKAKRSELAQALTEAIAGVAEVPVEKVQLFFTEKTPGPVSVEVHAVRGKASKTAWTTAIQVATRYDFDTRVIFYAPDSTARGGVLREPPASPESHTRTDPERP